MPPPGPSLRQALRVSLPLRPARNPPVCRFQHTVREWKAPPLDGLAPPAPMSTEMEAIAREPELSENHYDPKEWLLPIAPPPESRLKRISVYPAPPSAAKKCREPLREVARAQIETLDPTGSRTRLFAKDNKDAIQVGDIVLVRQRDGDPFSGVCMIIRRAGADTAILLRAQLTRIGVEMWFKIYSPTVTGIEVVQRTKKRKRRARLYYLRKKEHDVGSVEGVVRQYLKQRAVLGTTTGRDPRSMANRKGAKKTKK